MIRRPQFRLSTLLAVVTIAAVACGWLAWKRGAKYREDAAVAEIKRREGSVFYKPASLTFTWMERLLGQDRSWIPVEVDFDYAAATDADLALAASLPTLERLFVCADPAKPVTASGLAKLKKLPRLRWLTFYGHPIGDGGLMELQELVTLERLELREETISDVGIGCLRNLTNLKMLDLFGDPVPKAVAVRLREALPPNCEFDG
jgi:hypothetical protein